MLVNNLSANSSYRMVFLFVLCTAFSFGCQSTSEQEVGLNCQTEASENCSVEENNGDDRGYNPCLVNKNLTVCKND